MHKKNLEDEINENILVDLYYSVSWDYESKFGSYTSFISYIDYNKDKVYFEPGAENNIVILLSGNKPVLYLYLENDKVVSFDYIIKGDLAFFITY